MCLAHLHPKANICAQFYENWSKTEEVVRDARWQPTARPPDRRHADSYIPPLYTTCMRGYNKIQRAYKLHTLQKCYIVWLSLMRVTDWLNTVTWLTNISVCCPPQSCGGGTLLFPLLSRKQMAKWACDTIASNMYVDRPWPRAGCLLRAQYNKYALHCAQLNENPRWGKKKKLRENFYKFCRSRERQWGAMQYNRWRLCCRENHGMFLVSWGLKWYWGKIISPSTSSRDL